MLRRRNWASGASNFNYLPGLKIAVPLLIIIFSAISSHSSVEQISPSEILENIASNAVGSKIIDVNPENSGPSNDSSDVETGTPSDKTNDTAPADGITEEDAAAASPIAPLSSGSGGGITPEAENDVLSGFSVKSIQVSPAGNSGSASAGIPIAVPPGRKDIQPNISLIYGSSQRNGWLGVGWGLDMGAIQRNTKWGVDYMADDYVAVINGSASELVSREQEWGTDYYGARIEGAFLKYRYIRSEDRWVVTIKDGTRYFYGKDPFTLNEARQDNVYGTFRWLLVRVEDTNGNYMTVSYTKDLGEVYVDRIDYTGNRATGLAPSNYLKFHLDNTRTDIPVIYTGNSAVKTARRLKTIEVVADNDKPVRAYTLSYTNSNQPVRSLLTSVQFYGSDAVVDQSGNVTGTTAMPDISFSYEDSDSNGFTAYHKPEGIGLATYSEYTTATLPGDFNGDGMTDILTWDSSGTVNLFLSDGDGTFTIIAGPDGIRDKTWSGGLQPLTRTTAHLTGDYNGDGFADILKWQNDGNTHLFLSQGNGRFDSLYQPDGIDNMTWIQGNGTVHLPGDYDGDGMTDILIWQYDGTAHLLISQGNGTFTRHSNPTELGGIGWTQDHTVHRTGDYNGDGNTDVLMWQTDSLAYMFLSDGDGTFSRSQPLRLNSYDWVKDYTHHLAGDFNGDGKMDLLKLQKDIDTYLFLSEGTGTFKVLSNPGGIAPFQWEIGDIYRTGDFNGDGRTDILMWNYDGAAFAYLSKGNGTFVKVQPAGLAGKDWSNVSHLTGDYNGDSKTDILQFDRTYQNRYLFTWAYQEPLGYLRSIDNGIGGTTTITYEPSSSYANRFLPSVFPTLSSVTVDDGNGISSTALYTYSGGYFDKDDRSFWGFDYFRSKVLYNNPVSGATITEKWFNNSEFIFKGLVEEELTTDSAGNKFSQVLYYYDSDTPYPGTDSPHLTEKDDFLYDGTGTYKQSITEFEYDIYGNITMKYYHGDTSIIGDEKAEHIYYEHDEMHWILARPRLSYVTDSDGQRVAQEWFTYYPATTLIKEKEAWNDDSPNPVVKYKYDSYGNIVKVTDPEGNSVITIYDTATQSFPISVTDPLGYFTLTGYDYRFGKPLTETDLNGNTTTYEYDQYGRVLKVIGPKDDATNPTAYYEYPALADYGQIGIQKVKAYALEQHGTNNYITSETYFDGLGRTIKTRSDGPDSKTIVTETEYDDRGLVYREYVPYFETDLQGLFTEYSYDAIGRIDTVTFTDLTIAKTLYDKGVITYIDPAGHIKIEIKDIYGQLVEVQEYTGTWPNVNIYSSTLYGYDTLGNLEYVRDALNNETIITYDSLSRKISIYDPDMGLWEYDYDLNGNLLSQTDNKDQTIQFVYDELNRIKKKIYPDNSFLSYQYDEPEKSYSKGRLTTLTDLAGITEFYYDELGNTIKTVKTIDVNGVPTAFTTETTYDALGRTETLTYPDNPANPTVISYSYGTGGNLYQVINNTTGDIYAIYSGYNSLGQVGQIAFDNGMVTSYTYRTDNNRLETIVTRTSISTEYMNLFYQYDSVGNIIQITDNLDSTKTRTYVYDDLYRLTEADNTDHYEGKLLYQYDETGNMTYNCRYGHYNYNDANYVHAVTEIIRSDGTVADSYTYDLNGNMKTGAGRSFTYDYDNRPTSIIYNSNAVVSVYDANGQRVKKIATINQTYTKTTTYIGDIFECTDGQCTRYIFAGTNRIAKLDDSGNANYYHTDHLGSSTVITDGTESNIDEQFYYPYGEVHPNFYSNTVKHKFTGQEWDAETGLYYYGARYYDPKLARFISADTIVPDFADPQSLNRYTYTRNNPIIYTDPSGNSWLIFAAFSAFMTGMQTDWDVGAMFQSAAMAYVSAGVFDFIGASFPTGTHSLIKVTTHAVTGAFLGAGNAILTGGDPGIGFISGAISNGIGKGTTLGLKKLGFDKVDMFFGTVLAGGVAGGIVHDIYGGNFGQGFAHGAMSTAAGILYNEFAGGPVKKWVNNEFKPWAIDKFNRVFAGSNMLQGVGWREKRGFFGLVKAQYGVYDYKHGKILTHSGWIDYKESFVGVKGNIGSAEFDTKITTKGADYSGTNVKGIKLDGTVSFGASLIYRSSNMQAVSVELVINVGEIFK